MLRYFHTLSAVLFYCLGLSFFVAWVLLRNALGDTLPLLWLHTADLPLLLSGMLFGGLSMYRSLAHERTMSLPLILGITIPLLLLFGTALFLTLQAS